MPGHEPQPSAQPRLQRGTLYDEATIRRVVLKAEAIGREKGQREQAIEDAKTYRELDNARKRHNILLAVTIGTWLASYTVIFLYAIHSGFYQDLAIIIGLLWWMIPTKIPDFVELVEEIFFGVS